MQIGMIGLGPTRLSTDRARGASSLATFADMLRKPRVAWLMVPAVAVEQVAEELPLRFEPGDIIVDGGHAISASR